MFKQLKERCPHLSQRRSLQGSRNLSYRTVSYQAVLQSRSREARSRNQIAFWSRSRNYQLRLRLQLRFRPLSIYNSHEELLYKKIMVAEEVFVNCYNFYFNPVTVEHCTGINQCKKVKYSSQKKQFSAINYPEPELEPHFRFRKQGYLEPIKKEDS